MKHIPNGITCLNLLSGSVSIVVALALGDIVLASWLIVLCGLFDFFDGLVARWLRVVSPIGKDLDSLADVVSFGLAPSVIVMKSLLSIGYNLWQALPVLLLVVFSALRLAKFNNDTRQSVSFCGIPVPSNAFFWIGLALTLPQCFGLLEPKVLLGVIYVLIALFAYLMVSDIPMFSFKGLSLSFRRPQLWLVLLAIGFYVLWGLASSALIIVAYILLSLFFERKQH